MTNKEKIHPDDQVLSSSQAALTGHALNDLLDPSFEEAYDRITRLASKLLKVPIAMISVSYHERQFFKSFVGLGEPWATTREPILSKKYCQHVKNSASILKIENALEDPRLKADPVTLKMGVVAYLGIPMTLPGGPTVGSFCAVHTQPHVWSESDISILSVLADELMTEIQLRAHLRQAELSKTQAEDASRRATAILEQILYGSSGNKV